MYGSRKSPICPRQPPLGGVDDARPLGCVPRVPGSQGPENTGQMQVLMEFLADRQEPQPFHWICPSHRFRTEAAEATL